VLRRISPRRPRTARRPGRRTRNRECVWRCRRQVVGPSGIPLGAWRSQGSSRGQGRARGSAAGRCWPCPRPLPATSRTAFHRTTTAIATGRWAHRPEGGEAEHSSPAVSWRWSEASRSASRSGRKPESRRQSWQTTTARLPRWTTSIRWGWQPSFSPWSWSRRWTASTVQTATGSLPCGCVEPNIGPAFQGLCLCTHRTAAGRCGSSGEKAGLPDERRSLDRVIA
jgi:hypothetical protein